MKRKPRSRNHIPIGIRTVDSTQIQDHEMYPVSLNPIKRTVSSPKKPIPPLRDDDDDELIYLKVFISVVVNI